MNRKQAQHDAAVLPRIQELKAQGRSLREIADLLQQEGVPPPRRGGRWSHPAVGRILSRAERPRPEEASPPPPPAEEASPPPPPAEEPPALARQRQESEDQTVSAVEQLGARVQDKLGAIETQVDKRIAALNWSVAQVWVRPACVGLAICLGLTLASWGLTVGLTYSIASKLEERATLQREIARQQATLRQLEKQTWGVGYQETEDGRFLVLPMESNGNWKMGDKPAVRLPHQ